MIIKAGKFVSHAGALQWGAGKVLDVMSTGRRSSSVTA